MNIVGETLPKLLQGHLSQLPQDVILSEAKMSICHWKSSLKLIVGTIGVKVKFMAVMHHPYRTF